MQTELDPEQALRKRLRGQLTDTAATGQTEYGDSGYQFGGGPIPAAPFAPAQPSPVMTTHAVRDDSEPDPTPTVPEPAAPAPVTLQPVPPPPAGTPAPTIGLPGGIDEKTGGAPHPTYTVPQATTQSQAPAGWDQPKWDDASHTTTKYVVGRILAKYPPTVQGLSQAFAEIKAQFPGASFNGKDTLSGLPGTAGPVDVLMNASSGGSGWWWGDSGASGGGGAGGGAGASTGAGGAATTNTASMPTSPFLAQLRDLLMQRIAAAQTPVNESDEYIAGPLSAGRDEVSRGQDAERKALAERLYAQGDLNSGALTQQIQQSSERSGTALSQLRAGLISKEYSARREELQNYMQLAIASGDAEMARQLQLEIANLNAQLERERQGIGLSEFLANLNQNTVNAGAGR